MLLIAKRYGGYIKTLPLQMQVSVVYRGMETLVQREILV
jgi:hypothetical protein